jgi:phosphoribosylamine-glycine ligase
MKILAESIDSVDLEAINIVDDGAIPDVDMSADYADAVYLLYRAGVLTGSDSMGTFAPKSVISRAEAAAVITRIIDPTLRTSVELVGEY